MIENEEELSKAIKYRELMRDNMYRVLDSRSNVHSEFRITDREIREYLSRANLCSECMKKRNKEKSQ